MKKDMPVALVTGGASGIGRAIVERLARDGFSVVMLDKNEALAKQETEVLTAQDLSVQYRAIDITNEAAVHALVEELPPLSALINNAAIFEECSFDDLTAADFRRMFDVNLVGIHVLTQAAARKMQSGSKVVIIVSRAYLGARNHAHYVSSKAAAVGYMRAAAMELASRGILVNAIAPGMIDTPILRALTPERRKAAEAMQPTGKAGRPEDVANAVAFLSAPHLEFITGQVLFVDGGKSLGGSYS